MLSRTEPLELLARVRWSSLFAGAIAALAIASVLVVFGWGITMVSAKPTSWRGILVAFPIVLIVSTLIGTAFGGLFAGFFSGSSTRRLSLLHGFFAWCLAFLAAFWVGGLAFGSLVRTPGQSVASAGSPAVTGGGAPVAQGMTGADQAVRLFQALGYPADEATRLARQAQVGTQQSVGTPPSGSLSTAYIGGSVLGFSLTWFVSLLLMLGFSVLGAKTAFARTHPASEWDSGESELRQPEPPPTPTPPLRPREA